MSKGNNPGSLFSPLFTDIQVATMGLKSRVFSLAKRFLQQLEILRSPIMPFR